MKIMPEWPATRVTLLDRLHDPRDQDAWTQFVALYGPLMFHFARRRLPQDDDAADVTQEVLRAVMGGSYRRPRGRFQKWLVTVLLNKIRDFHSAHVRREVSGDTGIAELLEAEPSRGEEEEWDQERQRHLFHAAADRVQQRANPLHWEAFVRTALQNQPGQEVAHALNLSLTNVYAVKCRFMKEIKDEVQRLVEEMTTGDGHWLGIADKLRQPAPVMSAGCQRVLNEAPGRSTMTARIHIERMMHRNSIAVSGEAAAGYTLLKLIPSGLGGAAKLLGLNLGLVIDVSGSMYEEDGTGVTRLQRVKDAALAAIQNLRPDDTLAIVGFAHDARVLLPATPMTEKDRIEDVIRGIDCLDIDPGGTAMDEGLALAMSEVAQRAVRGQLSQIVILTDGETSGEQNCRALAQQAADKKIHWTLMGVGLDWKASLLKDLAKLSQGKWHFIDVERAKETTRVFAEEFETLAATAFLNVELSIKPTRDVCIKRLRQVVPEIKDVAFEESAERGLLGKLGTLQNDLSSRYIIELSLPQRPDGKYTIAQMELTYDLGTGQRESTGPIPLEITYTAAGQGYVNAEVMKHIDDIQLKELGDQLQVALQARNEKTALHIAQEMETKGKAMGERAAKKTMIAKQVLDELHHTSGVSRKTQLVVEDELRVGETA